MKPIPFQILGLGSWGPGFQNWSELQNILSGSAPTIEDAEQQKKTAKGPKPEIIPANERRRAPLPVRLAIESSWQASQHANIAPEELPSVFVSGIGDTQLTDYMCKVLAGENKALSPTKFHNSVHNAAAGYWTISTGCMQAANSAAGFQESVSLALMEAILQCHLEKRPTLLTFYDAPSSDVLIELLKNDSAFSASIVIGPAGTRAEAQNYQATVADDASQWPELKSTQELERCYQNNPVAKILALMNSIAHTDQAMVSPLCMPISSDRHLKIEIESPLA
jgi:hypothetical protein